MTRGTAYRGRRAAALAALALVGAAACSGGGDGEAGEATTTTRPSAAAELVLPLGCAKVTDPGDEGHQGWLVRDVRDCEDRWGGVSARVYASLSAEERDAGVRLLTMEGHDNPAPNGCYAGAYGTGIVAGDTWVAVVPGDAAVVADQLGGEVQATRVSPPASTPSMDCFPPPARE